MKKLLRHVKAGDIISKPWNSIVIKIKLVSDKNGFWAGKPYMTTYDLNDSFYGAGSREIDPEQIVEIVTDRKEIIKAFRIVKNDLASYIADTLQARKDFIYLSDSVVRKLNKKKLL
jgi:hypothetical protein